MLEETKQVGTMSQPMLSRDELMRTRRLKYTLISPQALVHLLRQGESGQFWRIKGMPSDAVIMDLSEHFAFNRGQYALRIWSSEFDVVPECETLPELVLDCSIYEEQKPRGREFI
jgi:hypothetical protein